MTRHILFLCPHAAAKSVLAMTYFAELAALAGLAVTVDNAGTEPDPAVNPRVAAYLAEEGFDVSGFVPSLLNKEQLQTADLIVSMGCEVETAVPEGTRYLDWSDVPMLSDGFQASRDIIYEHVQALVSELANS